MVAPSRWHPVPPSVCNGTSHTRTENGAAVRAEATLDWWCNNARLMVVLFSAPHSQNMSAVNAVKVSPAQEMETDGNSKQIAVSEFHLHHRIWLRLFIEFTLQPRPTCSSV